MMKMQASLKVSHSFGFGPIDAEAMASCAQYWERVPEYYYFHSTSSVSGHF